MLTFLRYIFAWLVFLLVITPLVMVGYGVGIVLSCIVAGYAGGKMALVDFLEHGLLPKRWQLHDPEEDEPDA